MKRAVMFLAAGGLIFGWVLSAQAQAPAAPAGPTVSFGGQMRVYGFAYDNITDFKDSDENLGGNRDSHSFYFQRWRLFTTVESADKKAKVYWALEVGDIVWGTGGGAASDVYGCTGDAPVITPTVTVAPTPPATTGPTATVTPGVPGSSTRVNRGAGGCLGNDGVNVETKNLYIWADTGQWIPGSSVLLGIHNILFMGGPLGAFVDDDGAGIQFNWKMDPIDLQVYTVKASEGRNVSATGVVTSCTAGNFFGSNACPANADDSDFYVARFGVNLTKDMRLTVEGMVIDQKSLAGQDFGDTFWVGSTFGIKIGTIQLDAAGVYGQRAVARAATVAPGPPFEESGYGGYVTARMPVGPLSIFAVGWYTTGDDVVGPATNGSQGGASTPVLTKDSDKLPIPLGGASWFGGGGPFIAEWLFGNASIGAPSVGQLQYADPTGTYGVGASATYALTPAFSVGGGAAYVKATDADGRYGENLIEVDGGITYRFNPNLVFNLFAGYLFPDTGDNAWAAAFRTQFSF